jgi:hypothetical protein
MTLFNEMDAWKESETALLQRIFELPTTNLDDWNSLKIALTVEIDRLISKHPEKLKHILYRIDINETNAAAAFLETNPALKLAELIIQRQVEKIASRIKNKH